MILFTDCNRQWRVFIDIKERQEPGNVRCVFSVFEDEFGQLDGRRRWIVKPGQEMQS